LVEIPSLVQELPALELTCPQGHEFGLEDPWDQMTMSLALAMVPNPCPWPWLVAFALEIVLDVGLEL